MISLVLLQSVALVTSITLSKVFIRLDENAFRLFNNTVESRVENFNDDIGALVENVGQYTEEVSALSEKIGADYGSGPFEIYEHDEAYRALSLEAGRVLIRAIRENNITGAFFLFSGPGILTEDKESRPGVYIRNTAPSSNSTNPSMYQMEIGPSYVAQKLKMTVGVNWRLHMHLGEREQREFYSKPIWAAQHFPESEIERYGYWSAPSDTLHDGQTVITYTMPLLDEVGNPFGVFGVEISAGHLAKEYLPNKDLAYQNSFYAISPIRDRILNFDWFVPSGPLAENHLQRFQRYWLEPVKGADISRIHLESLGDMYVADYEIYMYSKNSPFYDESWSLIGMTQKEELHQSTAKIRFILIFGIAITTMISILASILVSYTSTKRIGALSQHLKTLSPYSDIKFQKTKLREIDELTAAVELFNRSVIQASESTAKILKLSLLPIGSFEVIENKVILTDFIYEITDLEKGSSVDFEAWNQAFRKLRMNPSDRYMNIYQYPNPKGETDYWLRIIESRTRDGYVGVILDATKEIDENLRLSYELDHDSLTQLYNRTAFKREVDELIWSRPEKMGVLMFSDLDNLKYINDTFGHDLGDQLIIHAGEMFREFRQYGGVVSRISGDEFAIYLHGFDSKEEVRELLQQKLLAFESYSIKIPDDSDHKIRFSSGLAWYPDDADDVTDLLKLADFAMYEAKHNFKGSLYEFDIESYRKNVFLLENREAIHQLLDQARIKFVFQPIVAVETGEVFAYEALMRSDLENFKGPMEILAVAAAQSKLGALEDLVFRSVFKTINEQIKALGPARVFVNSIPSQLVGRESRAALKKEYGHLLPRIALEITEEESRLPEIMQKKINFARAEGMLIAIDDFGKGYSNEIRVINLKPDVIKIDMELIQGIHRDLDKQMLVKNILFFCKSKNIKTVAEGIEDAEDLAYVIKLGIDYLQGYYIGKPNASIGGIRASVKKEILNIAGRS